MSQSSTFQCIGIVGLPRYEEALNTHHMLYEWLVSQGYRVILDADLAQHVSFPVKEFGSLDEIGELADLAIIIGGDGNMLRAARSLSHHDIKVIGVNRGNLGFLTDINPEDAIVQLGEVLAGDYHEDSRFLLDVGVYDQGELVASGIAVNEIVLHPSKVAHMIDYEAYIDDRSAFSQRADGLIIATPTGSTAYSLSAGGPIIAPRLDAFIITPMFPHSLSVRPLVIKSDNTIRLTFPTTIHALEVACDSQIMLEVKPTDEVVVKRTPYEFNLIHSKEYDYFRNLSTKLGWSKKMY
ncbi:NAD(+) kinase [Zophobihabitans entericus]|uniref:NAD kinase n=1 Tax=Zophobihabitans entericus TaxID=1635327 RepID=A0A6G9IA95_9GAMM|nr:NAD(+) kinase [Zophobihabitans entericus]QIQ20752.1 NAD(+) kinase [Zophobihabitans entericus]